IGLATNAGMTAVTRLPIGRLRDDPDLRPLFVSACEETIAVAHASGIELPKDALAKVLDFIGHAPPAMKA
ncbi:MAG TPA: 2-dehydropantoate 2-reductase, partial [Bradyrhizobium sp.]|nr:2-dehydropantoate 2-reductase [Bradyrhizobium sp.]